MADGKDGKKREVPEEERSYTGTKDPADRAFAEWIARQWRRGEKLEKIDVVEYLGKKKGLGEVVDWETFNRTSSDVNMEDAVDLCNRFYGSAQINCERAHAPEGKSEMTYYARAFDRGRSSTEDAVDTFPIRIQARPRMVTGVPDGEEHAPHTVALDYLRATVQSVQWDKQREDTNAGDLIHALFQERREERAWMMELHRRNRELALDWVQAIREREAALSTEQDRLPARELMKIKAEILRDGFRAGKNMLTAAFSSMFGGQGGQGGQGQNGAAMVKRLSQEQMLIDSFFTDCKSAGIDGALFGEYDKDEGGKVRLIKRGVFTPEQFEILARVFAGDIPPEALDDLLLDSGKPVAVTMQQIAAAQKIEGMSEGISSSLVLLFKVRVKKRDEARAAAQAKPAAESSPTPVTAAPADTSTPSETEYTDV